MQNQPYEIALIGAGPIGIEMAACLKQLKTNYIHFESGQIGSTIEMFPESTHFYSAPERIALAGVPLQNTDQLPVTREKYLAYLRSVVEVFDLKIHTHEKVTAISRQDNVFRITTKKLDGSTQSCLSSKVILAIGDMRAPNRIDFPGSDSPTVHFELDSVHKYFRKKVLVVGGMNSAFEAVLRCFRIGAQVALSYRGERFDRSRVKPYLHQEVTMLLKKGLVKYYPNTEVASVSGHRVTLRDNEHGKPLEVVADFVLFRIGFRPDLDLLKQLQVNLSGEEDKPAFDPETMETNVPGVFLAGTVAGGNQKKYDLYIETSHIHVGRIIKKLYGIEDWHGQFTGSVPKRNYPFDVSEVQPEGEEE